jgi:hypothetical protein
VEALSGVAARVDTPPPDGTDGECPALPVGVEVLVLGSLTTGPKPIILPRSAAPFTVPSQLPVPIMESRGDEGGELVFGPAGGAVRSHRHDQVAVRDARPMSAIACVAR